MVDLPATQSYALDDMDESGFTDRTPPHHASNSVLLDQASQRSELEQPQPASQEGQNQNLRSIRDVFPAIWGGFLLFLSNCGDFLTDIWSTFKQKAKAKRDQWHRRAITTKRWLVFILLYLGYFIATFFRAIWAQVSPPTAKKAMEARLGAVKDTAAMLAGASATGLAVSFLSTLGTSGNLLARAENTKILWSLSFALSLLTANGALRLLQLIEEQPDLYQVTLTIRAPYVLFSAFLWASVALLWTGLSIFMWSEAGTTWRSKGATIFLWVALSFGFAAIITATWTSLERTPPEVPNFNHVRDEEQGGQGVQELPEE